MKYLARIQMFVFTAALIIFLSEVAEDARPEPVMIIIMSILGLLYFSSSFVLAFFVLLTSSDDPE